jgi:SAM-dependent methyltransferase
MNCIVCNSKDVSFVCKMNGYDIYRCKTCGLIYTSPMPDDKTINEFYQGFLFDKPNVAKLKSKIPSKKNELIKTIGLKEQDCKGKSFFDYGGGTGLSFAAAKACGFDTYYYDIDNQAIEFAIENLGLKPENIISNPENDTKKFDVILCDNVIEHVKDPKQLLSFLFGKVNEGGILVLKTPRASNIETAFIFSVWGLVYFKKSLFENGLVTALKSILVHRYWHTEPPRHLFSFSDKSMLVMAKESCEPNCHTEVSSYEIPFFKYSIGDVLLHIRNPFLRCVILLVCLPVILLEIPVIILRLMLVKLRLISLAGMTVRIVKK